MAVVPPPWLPPPFKTPSGGTVIKVGSLSQASAPAPAVASGHAQGVLDLSFGFDNLAANVTDLKGWRLIPGSAAVPVQQGVPMLYPGSIVGLVFAATESLTGGTATFEVRADARKTGARIVWSTQNRGTVAFPVGAFGFSAGEIIAPVATTAAFAPNTADVEVIVIVTFEPK